MSTAARVRMPESIVYPRGTADIIRAIMTRYFITGISGFLGRNLVLAIKRHGDAHIHGLVLPGDPAFTLYESDPDVTLVEGSLDDAASLERFLSEVEGESYVIHAAGRVSVFSRGDPLTTHINYDGTKAIVDAAKGKPITRFLFVSSVDALAQNKGETVEEPHDFDVDRCLGVYGKSKALAGNYVLNAYREEGFPSLIVCPSAIIGPDDPFMAPINDALRRFYLGKIPVRTPGGYDIVDVRDVAEGILLALEKGRFGETYLLTGNRVSVKELFATFAAVVGRKSPKIRLPYWILYLVAPFVELLAKIRKKRPLFSPLAIDCLRLNPIYDKTKAETELGHKVRPLKESVEDTYRYLTRER